MKFVIVQLIEIYQQTENLYCIERRLFDNGCEKDVISRVQWVKTIPNPLNHYQQLLLTDVSNGLKRELIVIGLSSLYLLTKQEVINYCSKHDININFIDYDN